jgi:hypothetical protein
MKISSMLISGKKWLRTCLAVQTARSRLIADVLTAMQKAGKSNNFPSCNNELYFKSGRL